MVRFLALGLLAGSLHSSAAELGTLPTLDPKYGEGCWVRFFDERDFKRPLARLPGPLYINSISAPGLIGMRNEEEFFGDARSVIVGPEAKFMVYAEPGFRKEIFALQPGTGVPDLGALGFPERAASLKIACERP